MSSENTMVANRFYLLWNFFLDTGSVIEQFYGANSPGWSGYSYGVDLRYGGVKFALAIRGDRLFLDLLMIDEECRGEGLASKFLTTLTEKIDSEKMGCIYLEACDTLGSDLSRLISFYGRFGFKVTRTGNGSADMKRLS